MFLLFHSKREKPYHGTVTTVRTNGSPRCHGEDFVTVLQIYQYDVIQTDRFNGLLHYPIKRCMLGRVPVKTNAATRMNHNRSSRR